MSNFKKETYKLTLLPDQENDWVNISVFDANNKLISKQMGGFVDDLPKGLYTVVSELSGATTEHIIKHTGESKIEMEMPKFSIVQSKVDYEQIARKQADPANITYENHALKEVPQSGHIFVFCHEGKQGKDISTVIETWKQLSIYDASNRRVLEMDELDWKHCKEEGWLCFQSKLQSGMYFFNYKKTFTNRSFSVMISEGYQTQVILPVDKHPDFDNIQMYMFRLQHHNETNYRYYDSYLIAKNKLLNADYTISKKVLYDLAYGKWDHPFYGLMGAYIYLLSGANNHDDLLHTVLENLENKIVNEENHPDITILKLLYQLRSAPEGIERWSRDNPITMVPIFRVGVEKIIELSFQYPSLIIENGIIDLIAGRLHYNTIWTCFKPTKLKYDFEVEKVSSRSLKANNLFAKLSTQFDDLKNIADLLDDFLPAIIELHKSGSRRLSALELAQSIGLPPITFKRKINELNRIINTYSRGIKVVVKYLEKFFKEEFNEDEVIAYIAQLSNESSEGLANEGLDLEPV